MFDPRNVFCAGTRFWSAQHKRYGNEPEEGETTQKRTERNGFGEKDDECACVRMFCVRTGARI